MGERKRETKKKKSSPLSPPLLLRPPRVSSLTGKTLKKKWRSTKYRPGVLVGNYCEEILLLQQQIKQSGEMETERGQQSRCLSRQQPSAASASASASTFAPSRESHVAAAAAANDARWGSVVRAEGRGAAEALFGVRETSVERKRRRERRRRRRGEGERSSRAAAGSGSGRGRAAAEASSGPPLPRGRAQFRPPVAQRPSFKPRGEATAVWDESLAQMNLRRLEEKKEKGFFSIFKIFFSLSSFELSL